MFTSANLNPRGKSTTATDGHSVIGVGAWHVLWRRGLQWRGRSRSAHTGAAWSFSVLKGAHADRAYVSDGFWNRQHLLLCRFVSGRNVAHYPYKHKQWTVLYVHDYFILLGPQSCFGGHTIQTPSYLPPKRDCCLEEGDKPNVACISAHVPKYGERSFHKYSSQTLLIYRCRVVHVSRNSKNG